MQNSPTPPERPKFIKRMTGPGTSNHKGLFICGYGNEFVSAESGIKNGKTKSCGCWYKASRRRPVLENMTHGHTVGNRPSRTYLSWKGMIARCTNPKYPYFSTYGGRGIFVCNRWRYFDAFLEDMGERPENLSLDRIDNNGHYCKNNCKWSTRTEQGRNQRSNVRRQYLGQMLTIREAMEASGCTFPIATVKHRVGIGWSLLEAVTIRRRNTGKREPCKTKP